MSEDTVVIPFPTSPMASFEQGYARHLSDLLEGMHARITYEYEGHSVRVESVHPGSAGMLSIVGIDSISGARVGPDEVPITVELTIAFEYPCVQLSFGDAYPELFLYREPEVA